MTKTELVAVYGSLKRGNFNHDLLAKAKYLGNFQTKQEFTMYDLGSYPAVVPVGDTSIYCEVYEVDERIFRNLDILEGYPKFYDRMRVITPYGAAWIYVFPENPVAAKKIPDGCW